MNLAEKKETLMHIVQDADDKLTGLMIAIANEYNTTNEAYTAEETENFYQIRDLLLQDPETGYSPTQAHDLIRNKSRNDT
jgi:hypothetical protein